MQGHVLVMARPPPPVVATIDASVAAEGLDRIPGNGLVNPANWHQSLSDRHQRADVDALARACAGIAVPAFALVFNRIRSSGLAPGPYHWTLLARGGPPPGFVDLLAAVSTGLATQGIRDEAGHSAHITLSYHARTPLPGTVKIAPIEWLVDEIELVVAGGTPYGYHTIARWPLANRVQGSLPF